MGGKNLGDFEMMAGMGQGGLAGGTAQVDQSPSG